MFEGGGGWRGRFCGNHSFSDMNHESTKKNEAHEKYAELVDGGGVVAINIPLYRLLRRGHLKRNLSSFEIDLPRTFSA